MTIRAANSTQIFEAIIGAIVVLVAALFLVFALNKNGNTSVSGYPLTATFSSAEGIELGGDVRMAGVKIGNVSDIELNMSSFQADVTVTIQDGVAIPFDSEIKIASEGLLGGSFVEISAGADMQVMVANDKFQYANGSIDLLSVLSQFATGGNK